jgi:choice-of-anchor A domain-containing protein
MIQLNLIAVRLVLLPTRRGVVMCGNTTVAGLRGLRTPPRAGLGQAVSGALVAVLSLLWLASGAARGQTINLGQYGVFEVSGAKGALDVSSSTIDGNIALGTSTSDSIKSSTVKGTISQGVNSSSAISSSSTAASLTPSATYGTITHSTTFTGTGPLNVYNLSGINLSSGNITINAQGHTSEFFVFNISGSVKMSSSSIILSNGANASHVLFNVLGGPTSLTSGSFSGTILDLAAKVSLTSTTLNGALLSEEKISIVSSTLNADPLTDPVVGTPEPATVTLGALACGALLGNAVFRRWKRRPSSLTSS